KQRHKIKVRLRCQWLRWVGIGLREVEFFINALVKKFEAHAGNDGESPEMEAVLSKDRTVPRLAGVEVAEHPAFCVPPGEASSLLQFCNALPAQTRRLH